MARAAAATRSIRDRSRDDAGACRHREALAAGGSPGRRRRSSTES